MAHVINLVAKAGIKNFDANRGSTIQLFLPPSLALIIEYRPTGNLSSILTQVRGFLKKANNSDQLTASLRQMINNNPTIKRKVGLIQEVSTRWWSTHDALQRFIEIKRVIFYQTNSEQSPYHHLRL